VCGIDPEAYVVVLGPRSSVVLQTPLRDPSGVLLVSAEARIRNPSETESITIEFVPGGTGV
jgi:hypothetical protein